MDNIETSQSGDNKILKRIKELADQGIITREQVLVLFPEKDKKASKESDFSFQKIFYFLGALIIILGFTIFISQFWMGQNEPIRVIFTLALTLTFYTIGYYLYYASSKLRVFSNVSFILSNFLLPLGLITFFDLVSFPLLEYRYISLYFFILFIIYDISFLLLRNNIFLLFSVVSISGLFLSSVTLLAGELSLDVILYSLVILGLGYFALAERFKSYRKNLVNIFHLLGAVFLLSSTFALSFDSSLWLFAFPVLLFISFLISIVRKNRILLIFSIIFTFAEIDRITVDFFSDNLGWPISLIIAGFSIMFIGYLGYSLNKKYMKRV